MATISAVENLLLFDELEELVAVLDGEELVAVLDSEELDVAAFDGMKDGVRVVSVAVPNCERVGVMVEDADGDIDSNVVVVGVLEVAACCSAPEWRKERRVNTILVIVRVGARVAQKRQRQHPSRPGTDGGYESHAPPLIPLHTAWHVPSQLPSQLQSGSLCTHLWSQELSG